MQETSAHHGLLFSPRVFVYSPLFEVLFVHPLAKRDSQYRGAIAVSFPSIHYFDYILSRIHELPYFACKSQCTVFSPGAQLELSLRHSISCNLLRQKDVFAARSTEALLYSDVANAQLSGGSELCTGGTSFSGSASHPRLFMLPSRIHVCRCHRLCSVFKMEIPSDGILHLFVKRLEGMSE